MPGNQKFNPPLSSVNDGAHSNRKVIHFKRDCLAVKVSDNGNLAGLNESKRVVR